MMNVADLPDDVAALKAIVVAVHARNERLEQLVAAFRQAMFGRKSERLDPDQFELALEERAIGAPLVRAQWRVRPALQQSRPKKRLAS